MDPEDSPVAPGGLLQSPPSPLPPQSLVQATPSDTTVTLPTPDPAHAQLAGIECHNPPRFIFYPISWDGSEDSPAQNKNIASPDLASFGMYTECVDDDQLNSPSAVFYSTDAFRSIDRWRRDVVKCGGDAADLLDPIQDAGTPLPLLSFPHHHGDLLKGTQPTELPLRGTQSSGNESDSVQLWIHP